jgi:hypothetical protein
MKESKDTSAIEALAAMGLTPEDIDRADQELFAQRKLREGIDRQICACGHGLSRHTVTAGIVYCKPARMECPCKRLRPLIETSDTRMFVRKTDGGGAAHALARGIKAAVEKGKSVEWVVDLVCDRCGDAHPNVVPVPVTQGGIAVQHATGYDALLCPDCRTEI